MSALRRLRRYRPRPRQLGYVAGVALIGVGAAGLLRDVTDIVPWARWFAAGVLVHDLLFAPAVLGASWLLTRLLSRLGPPWRAALQAGLVVAGSVSLVALPLVLAYGRRAANPSILPLDYSRNLVAVLVTIGLGACGLALLGAYRRGRRRGASAAKRSLPPR